MTGSVLLSDETVAESGFISSLSQAWAQALSDSASRHPGSRELEKLLRACGKTQEIFTPPHQFSQIPLKPNPTMRSNFSPGSDPQMLPEWTLCFPHHKIIQVLTRQLLASGSQSQSLQRAWRMVLMILPSGSSYFWHQSRADVQRLFHQTGPVDVMGLAKFQSLFWPPAENWAHTLTKATGTMGEHQVDSPN